MDLKLKYIENRLQLSIYRNFLQNSGMYTSNALIKNEQEKYTPKINLTI